MIKIENISYKYGQKEALSDVSLTVNPGEIWAILGLNGSGKSTLLKALGNLIEPKGERSLNGVSYKKISGTAFAKKVAWLGPQDLPPFSFTVEELLHMGRFPYSQGLKTQEDSQIVETISNRFNLIPFLKKPFSDLSSGEKQRVLLAKTWVQSTPYILLDEPCEYLDLPYQYHLRDMIIQEATQNRKALVCSIHDISFALSFATHVALLKQGHILAQGKKDQLDLNNCLSETFNIPFWV